MTREEAVEVLNKYQCKTVGTVTTEQVDEALDMAIEALKAQEWIPCSERMPETIGEYLITVQTNQGKKHITTAGYYFDRLKEFGTFRRDGAWEKWDAIAWMPLSPAYK